jgi:hypothetical protein
VSAGSVSWPPQAPVWTFSWEVNNGESEAIAFKNVFFRGRKVLHKASLPMIRVQYDSGNGPYKDALSFGNMRDFKIYEGTNPAYRFLVVESYHTIGNYRLTNRWIFRSDGIILPQLYSAGLQHQSDHRHHCYWRFDFDIDGQTEDLTLWQQGWGDWGYGPGWWPIRNEGQFTKFDRGRVWAVLNKPNGIGYMIEVGPFDGVVDSFGRNDVSVTLYKGPEDLRGALGTAADDQIWQHVNGENVDGQDIVFWYCAHLQHHVHDGGDEWHVCGPILRPFGY